jgi:hypothetical protein
MRKENYKKLCEKCKIIVRAEDTQNRRKYRLKIKEAEKQVVGKVEIKKSNRI